MKLFTENKAHEPEVIELEGDFDKIADIHTRENVVYIKGTAYYISTFTDADEAGDRQAKLVQVECDR